MDEQTQTISPRLGMALTYSRVIFHVLFFWIVIKFLCDDVFNMYLNATRDFWLSLPACLMAYAVWFGAVMMGYARFSLGVLFGVYLGLTLCAALLMNEFYPILNILGFVGLLVFGVWSYLLLLRHDPDYRRPEGSLYSFAER